LWCSMDSTGANRHLTSPTITVLPSDIMRSICSAFWSLRSIDAAEQPEFDKMLLLAIPEDILFRTHASYLNPRRAFGSRSLSPPRSSQSSTRRTADPTKIAGSARQTFLPSSTLNIGEDQTLLLNKALKLLGSLVKKSRAA